MISGYECRPVFQYKFRPLNNGAQDGGFSVILYENSILSFSIYDLSGAFMDETCFSLPGCVLQYFYSILKNAESWLGYAPQDLRNSDRCDYASSFAFDGYDPVRVWGMEQMLVAPMGTAEGFYSRHICVLFEDISNLLVEYGIEMTLRTFQWSGSKAQPFKRPQQMNMNNSGIMGVV